MKRDFEKYFPLPWKVETDEDGTFWMIAPAQGRSFLDFGTIHVPKNANVCDVMNYIVLCANLMPEAVAIIKDLCDAAMAADSSIRGLEMTEKVIQRAEALLAKLKGGAEDERD